MWWLCLLSVFFFKVFKRVSWWSFRVSTPFSLLLLILLTDFRKNASFRQNVLNYYLNTTFTFGKRTEDNFINRKVRCRPTYAFIHSCSCPLFLYGEPPGQQPLKNPKYLTINRNFRYFCWLPHLDGTKQGRRCSHATWSLHELCFAVFESSRFVTTEQWSSRRTAFAAPISVSIPLFRLPSLVHTIPRYLNVSTCCSVFPLTCRKHCLARLVRHNTSIFLVLIFVPAWLYAAENRSNACWKPWWENPCIQYQFVRKKQMVHPPVPNSDCLSPSSYRPGLSKVFGRGPHTVHYCTIVRGPDYCIMWFFRGMYHSTKTKHFSQIYYISLLTKCVLRPGEMASQVGFGPGAVVWRTLI